MSQLIKKQALFIVAAVVTLNFSGIIEMQGQTNLENPNIINPATEISDSVALSDYEELEDIEIVANKPYIKSDGASITYDISEDPTSKGSSLLDMLRKVPGITVDAQDNVYLNGRTGFKIYINGHEDVALSQYGSTILKMMPADAISKIEVINEPGAKYDAEGSGGILNLITEQNNKSENGFLAKLMLNVGNRDLTPGINFRFKNNKVTTSINVNYSQNLMTQNIQSHTITDFLSESNIAKIDNLFSQKVSFNYLGVNSATSWEISKRDLFSIDINFSKVNGSIKKSKTESNAFSSANELVWTQSQLMTGSMKNLNLSTQASYKHDFNESGHNLIITYLLNYGRNPMTLDQEDVDHEYAQIGDITRQAQINYDRAHTAQVDYTLPLNQNHKIEAGAKGVFYRNTGLGDTYMGNSFASLSLLNSSKIRQQKDIAAVYASYIGTFGHLILNAGLRYEYTRMALKYPTDKENNFSKHLNDPVPNAALTWSFSPVQNLRLAYQMRIARPTIEQVNPYKMEVPGREVSFGNPDLNSQRENKISLTYTHFAGILGGNVGVDYSVTNNVISEFSYVENSKRYKTYANLGKRNEIGLNGFLVWNIVNGTSLTVGGRVSRFEYKSEENDIDVSRFIGNYYANLNTLLPGKIKLSAYGGQGTGWASAQQTNSGWYYYGLGLSRDFLANDALTLALNAGNFLTKNTWMFMTTRTPDMIQHESFKMESWRVGISLSWTFGNLKSDVKKINVNASMDDAVKSENHTGSGF